MPKNLVYIGVVVLVVIAVVLGYKIYQQRTGISSPQTGNTTSSQSTTSNKQNTTGIQKSQAPADPKRAEVLKFPGPNATDAEKKAHSDLVNSLGDASGTPFLDISGCYPNPVVYRIKLGGTIKVKNSDSANHTIYTDPQRKTTIKANSEQTVDSKAIGDNGGDFGYNCDGSTSAAGIIQIVP